MKKVVLILFVGLLVFSMIVNGCSKPTQMSEQTPVSEEESKQKELSSPKVIELKAGYFFPESIVLGTMCKKIAERVEEQSNGRVKIKNYFSESLLAQPDTYTGLSSGIADIALVPAPFSKGIHDLVPVFAQLFEKEPPSREGILKAYQEILKMYPEIQDELAETGTRIMAVVSMPFYNLVTVDRPVRVPEDLKGMRITCQAGEPSDWINSIPGVAAVDLKTGDYYMGLERGLVNGMFTNWEAIQGYNLLEVVKHHTIFGGENGGAYSPAMLYQINLNTWNSLPPDIQEILEEAFQWGCEEQIQIEKEVKEQTIREAQEQGNTIIYLTPEERQLWVDYMKPITEKWIKETEAKGLPGRKIYDDLMRFFDEYR